MENNNLNLRMVSVDIDELIIQERTEDIKTLHDKLDLIKDIFNEFAIIVNNQGAKIEEVHENVEKTKNLTEKSFNDIKDASKHQKNTCVIS